MHFQVSEPYVEATLACEGAGSLANIWSRFWTRLVYRPLRIIDPESMILAGFIRLVQLRRGYKVSLKVEESA